MKKRELVMMLIVVLSLSLLMGCGKDDSEATSSTAVGGEADVSFPLSEPVTMSAFAIIGGKTALGDTWAIEEMTKKTNIHWDIQDSSGVDLVEKRNLLIGTNDYPDVFIKSGFLNADINKYGAQGVFIPLQDLIAEYAPNLTKLLDEHEMLREILTSGDGNIYSLPEVSLSIPLLPMYFINYQWLKNLNLAEPTNLDELYVVLKAFKEQDANGNGDLNDEIPLLTTKSQTIDLFATYMGVPYDRNTKLALIDGEFEYFPSSAEYKELLTFVTKLYSEDLMHTDSFTMEHVQQSAIGKSGDVLGSFFDMGSFLAVTYDNSVQYNPLTPFTKDSLYSDSGVFAGTFAITDVCETPELAIAWADLLYDEEGGVLAWMGIEDRSYKILEDGSYDWIIPEGNTILDLRNMAGLQGSANHPSIQPRLFFNAQDPYAKETNRQRIEIIEDGSVGMFVPPVLEATANREISTIKADIDIYVTQYMAQVCTGALDLEESWDEYLETLNAMGANNMFEIYMTAYGK